MKATVAEFQGLQSKAVAGDKEAQFLLATEYDNWEDPSDFYDPAKAVYWYQKSVEQGYAPAQAALGELYLGSDIVEEDAKLGLALLEKAAIQGYTAAQIALAGWLDGENPQCAFKWYLAAAKSGDSDAQGNVARYYEEGIAIPKNNKEAFKWALLAAEQGGAWAILFVGCCYADGIGVAQDWQEAIRWLVRIADPTQAKWRPNHTAQEALAYIYVKRHVQSSSQEDLVESYKWFCLAISYWGSQTQWDKDRRSHLISERRSLESKMMPQQVERAQSMASRLFRPFDDD